MITYLSKDELINYLNKDLSFQKISDEIYKKYNKKVSRQRIHAIYKQYKKKYPEEFNTLQNNNKDISIEQLKSLLKNNYNLKDICNKMDISYDKLRRYMNKNKIEYKTKKEILDKDLLYKLYICEELTDKDIAAKYRCSQNTIRNLRSQYEISRRKTQ